MSLELTQLLEAVSTIRDELKELVEKLDLILGSARIDTLKSRDGEALGKAYLMNRSATIIPTVPVAEGDPAVTRFLIPKVLERMKAKYGIEYDVENRDGKLRRLTVLNVPQAEYEKLKRAVEWALEKASARIRDPGGEASDEK